jgi:hypothetical protein
MKRTQFCRRLPGLLGFILALAGAGCGGEETPANQVPAPSSSVLTDAAGNRLVLDAAELKIDQLVDHKNPVVSNNAKQLKLAMEANDYTRTAQSLSVIASLRLDQGSEAIVRDALHKLVEVATAAAAKGDGNAKFALEFIKDTFGG